MSAATIREHRQCRYRLPVNGERPSPYLGMIGGTGPMSIFWPGHHVPAYGIEVSVFDLLTNRFGVEQITITTAAALPEAVMDFAVGLPVGKLIEKTRCFLFQVCDGTTKDRLLHRLEKVADVVMRHGWPDEDMNVFGHDDVSPQMILVMTPSLINGLDEPLTAAVLAEKCSTMKAGKGQRMGMNDVVEPSVRLTMRMNFNHAASMIGAMFRQVASPSHAHAKP